MVWLIAGTLAYILGVVGTYKTFVKVVKNDDKELSLAISIFWIVIIVILLLRWIFKRIGGGANEVNKR